MSRRRGLRRTAAAGAVLMLLMPLAACADEGEEYCEALAEEKATLTELAESSVDGGDVLTPTLESFETLRAAAPEELQDEWETLVVAYEAIVDAVDQAGIDPEEYRPDDLPEGVSGDEAERLASVASKLLSPRVREATAGIEQHAIEVCDVSFTG